MREEYGGNTWYLWLPEEYSKTEIIIIVVIMITTTTTTTEYITEDI